MAATSDLEAILLDLLERTGLGFQIPSYTGTTTTLTFATSYGVGPWSAARFPVGSPIIVTSTTGLGDKTSISTYRPDTGVVTVNPAITTSSSEALMLYAQDDPFWHFDRVVECVNRALVNRISRWQKVPLTYVPDGAYLGAIASFWTASAGTASYQTMAVPEVFGQAIQISHSSSANVQSNTIPVRGSETWNFDTHIRATTDGDTATFEIIDITNTAVITPSYEQGTGSTTSRGFVQQKGTFAVPATCDRIAFRLTVSGSGTMTAQMAPIVAAPMDARSFPLATRVISLDRVGNFYYPNAGGSNSGPDERGFRGPITTGGREHSFSYDGDHFTVTFNFSPSGPVYYDEQVFGSALSVLTDTTTFALDQVVKWAAFELFDYLMKKAEPKRKANEVNPWLRQRNAALRSAQGSVYEPELVNVAGRR